jgi:ornithine cyclodeaminase/alanine dehydrogenase
VTIYNANSFERADRFAKTIKGKLMEKFVSRYQDQPDYHQMMAKRCDIEFVATDDIEAATRTADIIITATPSRAPLIRKEWVKPGTHITCIGADMEGKQEIDENLFAIAKVYVDDVNQAVHVGELEIPIKKGVFRQEEIVGEIGQLILGQVPGRTSAEEITIFDSTGIALQDLLTADYVLKVSEEKGLGSVVDL